MADELNGIVKLLIPGSPWFLLLAMSLGVALLFGTTGMKRWGRRWLVLLAIGYLILSMQGTSDLLVNGLRRGHHGLRQTADARGAHIVVVLGNGAASSEVGDGRVVVALNAPSRFNALEGARLYRLLGDPLLLVSGGPAGPGSEALALKTAIAGLGVPGDRIVVEDQSATTREQSERVTAWLRSHGEERFVLVTTPEHVRRANGTFQALGVTPVVSPSDIKYGGAPFWYVTRYALSGSSAALYEYAAVVLYRIRGWA